jgi:hypothetical protein
MSPLELEMAAAEVAKAKADIALMGAVLQKCAIAAPFSGRVAERLVQRYQYVKAGDPILDILDDSQLEVTVLVPSSWLKWLKPGYEFKVFLKKRSANIRPRSRCWARVSMRSANPLKLPESLPVRLMIFLPV